MNLNEANKKYLLINTATNDHEVGLWNMDTTNCDILFKVNSIKNQDKKPLTIELPNMKPDENELDYNDNNIIQIEKNLQKNFSELKKFTYKYSSNYIRNLLLPNIHSNYYQNADKRFNNILSVYDTPVTAQCAVSPYCDSDNNNPSYLFTAGNDMTIRYWDISKDGVGINEKRSYIFNAPNSISEAIYSKSCFNHTTILQSNEEYKLKTIKKDMEGFSEYLNFNGNAYYANYQNEFDENDENLKYCQKISDPAHTSIITDLLPFGLKSSEALLISSSWDGTIKIWK